MSKLATDLLLDWVETELRLDGYEHKEIISKIQELQQVEKQNIIKAYNLGAEISEENSNNNFFAEMMYHQNFKK